MKFKTGKTLLSAKKQKKYFTSYLSAIRHAEKYRLNVYVYNLDGKLFLEWEY